MTGGVLPGACGNCGGAGGGLELLNEVDPQAYPAMTSDARGLEGRRFLHYLCGRCACVGIAYDPADALEQHYRHAYDLSDTVQNNLVVRDGTAMSKKSALHAPLVEALAKLPASGVRVLEVACGVGQLIQTIAESHPSWECIGIDPSDALPSRWPPSAGAAGLVRAFFRESELPAPPYDVIIEHGFLNRSAPLEELARTRRLCADGGLLSMEVMILEDSPHAPRIWDHSYMYLQPVLEAYLSHSGFRILQRHNNGTTLHLLCEAHEAPGREISVAKDLVAAGRERFRAYEEYWRGIEAEYKRVAPSQGVDTYLYGAGMFSGILIGIAGTRGISAVIDDIKAGTTFHGLPVIALSQARPGGRAVICARPHYTDMLSRRAAEHGLQPIPLSGRQ
jgi:SAM-dependent methyltransferase